MENYLKIMPNDLEAEQGFHLCRVYKGIKIYSNFVIVAKELNTYKSLTKEQINKYTRLFRI